MALVKEWGQWFIQFPKSTYIKKNGFYKAPFFLPKYYNEKLIFIEFVRQMIEVHLNFLGKHKVGLKYPFQLGYYSCPSIIASSTATKELQALNLKKKNLRENFDRKGKTKALGASIFLFYKPNIKYVWVDIQDEFEVRMRSYNKLAIL